MRTAIASTHLLHRAGGAVPILFAHYGAPWIRGSERVLLDLLAHLDRRRVAPVVWCNTEIFAAAARELGVPAHVSPMEMLLGWDPPRYAIGTYRRLKREAYALIARYGIRLVHANSGAPNQWLVPVTRRLDLPLVTHLHAIYSRRDRCTLRLYEAPTVVGCSDGVLAPFLADGVPARRLRTIYNGVDAARLDAGSASEVRAAVGVAPADPVLLGVGSLLMGKGWDVLLRATRHLQDRGKCPTVVLVGDGPDAERLRAIAESLGIERRVRFLGERRDVGALLRDVADVAVLPSRFEAFGLAAAEAGYCGVPCVVSDIPGLREVVVPGETGLYVPVGDDEALARAIAALIDDVGLRMRMRSAASAHVRAHFTISSMTTKFHALYDELLRAPHFSTVPWRQRLSPWWRLGREWTARRLTA